MFWLLISFATLAFVYLSLVVGLAIMQRRLLYRPMPGPPDPASAGTPWMDPVVRDGRLLGWYAAPPAQDAPVLVFFHGNRGTLGRVANKMAPWRNLRIGLFAATYRGYEGNPGEPNERGLYMDGRATLDWLADMGTPAERIILYGESLGCGVAVQMAVERPIGAVVLEAPYVSMPDLASSRYPWTPAGWLIRDRFDSLAKIHLIAAPILILHGEADRTIPIDHGRRLADKALSARFVAVPGANHIDCHERGGATAFSAFITTFANRRTTSDG
jgi:fermentation-respiration switch protein FrsA (DUF1100 family)